MEYALGQRQVVMNFSEKFCKTENEVLSSACFAEVWGKYIKNLYKTENQTFLFAIQHTVRHRHRSRTLHMGKTRPCG